MSTCLGVQSMHPQSELTHWLYFSCKCQAKWSWSHAHAKDTCTIWALKN